MTKRYCEITRLCYCDVLYDSFTSEKNRTIITRWRLSCHSLKIETGRRKDPPIPRHERYCAVCLVVEDENHALFACKAHDFIRFHYRDLINKLRTVTELLHPKSNSDVNLIANYLSDIEENRNSLEMIG